MDGSSVALLRLTGALFLLFRACNCLCPRAASSRGANAVMFASPTKNEDFEGMSEDEGSVDVSALLHCLKRWEAIRSALSTDLAVCAPAH